MVMEVKRILRQSPFYNYRKPNEIVVAQPPSHQKYRPNEPTTVSESSHKLLKRSDSDSKFIDLDI